MRSGAILLRVILSLLMGIGFSACRKPGGATMAAAGDVDYYTCTMHPWVHAKKPGTCPVCGMDLVPVYKSTRDNHASQIAKAAALPGTGSQPTPHPESHDFVVPMARQQQFGVTYARAKRQRLVRTVRTVGLVAPDKGRQWMFVPRTDGYVQKLYITSPGQVVEKGQDLLQVYSPDLATSQQELIKLLESRDRGATRDVGPLIESAERRLRQWNLTAQQIEDLEKSRIASEYLTLVSPFKGVVEDVPAEQGERFSMGQKLISVADLSVVWVWAEFYQNEIPIVKTGQTVTITFDPDQSFTGVVAVVNPFVSGAQRTTKTRIDLSNPSLQLRPGMYVNAELAVDLGEGLTIPVNAVLPTGNRNIVFLDKGNGKLQPSVVQLGSQVGEAYQVLSGLKENDRIVASANFLIDAESQVQGALQGFEQDLRMPPPASGETGLQNGLGHNSTEPFASLLRDYSAMQEQLAQNQTDLLSDSLNALAGDIHVIAGVDFQLGNRQAQFMKSLKELDQVTESALQSNDLQAARVQFGKISAALIELLSDYPPALAQDWKVMMCPGWTKSPARWLQTDQEIHNPFIGAPMSACGQTIGSIGTMNLKAADDPRH